MTSGSAVLSYNTVLGDTITQDISKMVSQKGAKQFRLADSSVAINIPTQALTATPSKKSCRWNSQGFDTSYLLDVVYYANSTETGPLYLYVDYVVDFYTPQLN